MVKNSEVYENIIYSDKPNCPNCDIRNYSIVDNVFQDRELKFYAKCNECNTNFVYVKSIDQLGGVKDETIEETG